MNDWRETTLGAEIDLAYGKALPAHARSLGNVRVFGSNGVVGEHDESLVAGPGIVVGRKGSVGALAFSTDNFWPIDTTYYVVNKRDHNWRYLYHLLGSCGLTRLNSHSAVPGLNREDVYSIAVRMPPRDIQDGIVRALDCIAEAIELERLALANAEALLRAAAGELFSKGLRGEKVKATSLGLVPDNWSIVGFDEIREWLQYGTSVHCTVEASPYPVLRIPNIAPGRVNSGDLKYAKLTDREAARYLLTPGDLLFIRTNGVRERLGACAVYRGEPEGALFASYLIRARLKPVVDPRYVAYFYGSQIGTDMVAGHATPAADGKYNLNTGAIDGLLLPLPPSRAEQEEIVSILEVIDQNIDLHRKRLYVLEDLLRETSRSMVTGDLSFEDIDNSILLPEPDLALKESA